MAKNSKYVALFLKEAGEHLASLTKGLLALESSPADEALNHELMRNAHTIKGAARMLGFEPIGAIAHWMEDLFRGVEASQEQVTPHLIDLLLSGCDVLHGLIDSLAAGQEEMPDATQLLDCLIRRELPPKALLEALQSRPAVAIRANDEVRLSVAALDSLQDHLGELIINKQRFEVRLKELKRLARSAPLAIAGLWEFQVRLEDDILELEGLLAEINAQILALRLLPLRTVTDGFARVMRDVVRAQGKQATLTVVGADIELDRALLEQLRPVFVHLLTNAVTHGLESPAERELAGKPAVGAVIISARLEGEEAVIVFQDDGRGMNPAAIRAQAVSRALLTPEQAATASDEEVLVLTLRPGFSTSASVTAAAGRGVGLDAVQQSLKKVKGSLAINNEPGRGCAFVLAVPRMLLTTRVLLVSSGGERYLIPLGAIDETRSVRAEDFATTDREPRLAELAAVPVADLGLLLGKPAVMGVAAGEKLSVVVLKQREKRLACLVDSLHDTVDVVFKRLSPQLKRVFLVSGATVLPDGAPALILNVTDLFAAAEQSCSLGPLLWQEQVAAPRILVVDDSVTSRTLEATILAAQGYRVEVADNGMEALEELEVGDYRLVISDVEMPRMNGLELVRQIRRRFAAYQLPIMIVSSLNSGSDRQQALAAGAQLYLAKGEFDQDLFLGYVKQLLDNAKGGE
jgi:two-component system, chemotaxis family, sensor kinase CheA